MAQVIGFIGLGIMGRPMAKNLVKAGHALLVHNRSQAAVQELVGLGAKVLFEVHKEEHWTVMADPEGNEFCAVPPEEALPWPTFTQR